MYAVISVLVVIVSLLLILIVLVQNSKGGGLASNFSSSNQVMGVRKTTDFLEKATWTLSIFLLVLCIGASAFMPHGQEANDSMLKEKVETTMDPTALPNFSTGDENGTEEPKDAE